MVMTGHDMVTSKHVRTGHGQVMIGKVRSGHDRSVQAKTDKKMF